MFHNLPDEINMKILDICKEILNPIEFYNLKNVNQVCKKEILKFKNLYEYFTNNHYQKIIDLVKNSSDFIFYKNCWTKDFKTTPSMTKKPNLISSSALIAL